MFPVAAAQVRIADPWQRADFRFGPVVMNRGFPNDWNQMIWDFNFDIISYNIY